MSEAGELAALHVQLHERDTDHSHGELHARVAALEDHLGRIAPLEAAVAELRHAAEAARDAAESAASAAEAAAEHAAEHGSEEPEEVAEHAEEAAEEDEPPEPEAVPAPTHRLLRRIGG